MQSAGEAAADRLSALCLRASPQEDQSPFSLRYLQRMSGRRRRALTSTFVHRERSSMAYNKR
jgi:hypothetical protein